MDQSHDRGVQFTVVEQDVGTCCIINMIQNNEMQMGVHIGICIWWNHFMLQSLFNSKWIHTKHKHQPFNVYI
jgi:hypothetical protein